MINYLFSHCRRSRKQLLAQHYVLSSAHVISWNRPLSCGFCQHLSLQKSHRHPKKAKIQALIQIATPSWCRAVKAGFWAHLHRWCYCCRYLSCGTGNQLMKVWLWDRPFWRNYGSHQNLSLLFIRKTPKSLKSCSCPSCAEQCKNAAYSWYTFICSRTLLICQRGG